MKARLSPRLSPEAKKRLLRAGPDDRLRALIQVAANADREALTARLAALGAGDAVWMEETGLIAAELPAARLGEVAELPGVVYVDAATAYRR